MNFSGNSMYDILSKDLHRLKAILDLTESLPLRMGTVRACNERLGELSKNQIYESVPSFMPRYNTREFYRKSFQNVFDLIYCLYWYLVRIQLNYKPRDIMCLSIGIF